MQWKNNFQFYSYTWKIKNYIWECWNVEEVNEAKICFHFHHDDVDNNDKDKLELCDEWLCYCVRLNSLLY